jgi:transcriptional regulator with XRE-family HTH domain
MGGLERQEENPTVDLLDRLAKTLSIHISELLIEPPRGAPPPRPLRRGRRSAK